MNIIVTDEGFGVDDWTSGYHAPEDADTPTNADNPALALDLPNTTDVARLTPVLDRTDLIRIDFPSFADGRGFSLARQLRTLGYQGRLRAKGHVLADQYAMARRSGFDEVEIDEALATRQPEDQWLARADWQTNDYQNRLRQYS